MGRVLQELHHDGTRIGSRDPAKRCLDGHEWLKRQLTRKRVRFEPLDNGIRACASPDRVQPLATQFDATTIDTVFRKWLARLPHPFTAAQRAAGYRYQLSILQAEFALTQLLDRPVSGRAFFEEVIRENLDIGRPDQVQAILDRRVIRTTPGRFRTRVITEGVTPSLHVDFKASRIKQYHKEGHALRTETTINNTYDFQTGRSLRNLPALRELGFAANRRLLRVQTLSHDCLIGDDRFQAVISPVGRWPARGGAPLWGPARPGPAARTVSVCRPADQLSAARCAGARGGAARARAHGVRPRRAQL